MQDRVPPRWTGSDGLRRREVLAYAAALPVAALVPLHALAEPSPIPGARAIEGRWDVYDLPPAGNLPVAARRLAVPGSPSPDGPPRGGAAGPDGRLWFTDWENSRIGCRSPATGTVSTWDMPLGRRSGPSAIVVDGAGTIYVGEFIANRIARFDQAAARFTGSWELPLPRARIRRMAVDENGCVWYADDGNSKLARLS